MKLRFTSRAADEIEEILGYIRERSPEGARNVRRRLQELTFIVSRHPNTGRLTTSGLRRLTATPYPYVIFYEVLDSEVVVVGVRHASRDPSSMSDA